MNQTLQTLRRQLQQLEELHGSGALAAAAYQDGKAAVERKLIDLVMSGESLADKAPTAAGRTDPAARPSRRLLMGLGIAIVVFAAVGYWRTGSPGQAGVVAGAARTPGDGAAGGGIAPNGGHAVTPEQIADMADKLALRLKGQPDDGEGWAMLARSYSMLKRYADAVPAYERAVALHAEDATLLADYADALAVTNKGSLAGEPMKVITRALKLDPDNLKALSLAGTEAFDRKDYATALRHWTNIVRLGPADSELVQQVKSSITEARELSGLPATAAAASVPAGGASVSGSVAIAAALAGRPGLDDTVFVFARAAEGPRMPLAILRKQVRDLPFEFKLDDSMAMADSARLSSVSRLVVGVRISKSGDAAPAAGDLVGQSGPIAVGASGVRIEVAEIVKQ